MSHLPLVSIVVPVFRVEKYLRDCVDSLLAQSYGNCEIILVDDCSDDSCGKICDEYSRDNTTIKTIHLKKNSGLSAARNAAVPLLCGEYVVFVDSDDAVSPEYIADFMAGFNTFPKADIVQCGHMSIGENDCAKKTTSTQSDTPPRFFLNDEVVAILYGNGNKNIINFTVWNKMFKRNVLDIAKFEEGALCEDVIFTSKLVAHGASIAVINNKNYFYRQRQTSIMGDMRTNAKRLISNHCLAYSIVAEYCSDIKCDFASLVFARLGIWYVSAVKYGILYGDKNLLERFKKDCKKYKLASNKKLSLPRRIVIFIANNFQCLSGCI